MSQTTPTPTDLEKQIGSIKVMEAGDVGDFEMTLAEIHPEAVQQLTTLLQTICLTAKPESHKYAVDDMGYDSYDDAREHGQSIGYNQAISDYETNLRNLIEGQGD